MVKATPDTNILVSAVVFRRGKPHELLQRALSGEVSLAVSPAILDEMADVLARKFSADADDIAEARAICSHAARTVNPAVQLNVVKADPNDDRILECAVSAGSNYIVTGDKHLLQLGRYDSIGIVKVSEFLDLIKSPAREI